MRPVQKDGDGAGLIFAAILAAATVAVVWLAVAGRTH